METDTKWISVEHSAMRFATVTTAKNAGMKIADDCEHQAKKHMAEAIREWANQWQPIDTAPKDGVVFNVFVPHDEGGFQFAGVISTKGRVLCMMSGDDFTGKATHWMPLPQPPTDAI